ASSAKNDNLLASYDKFKFAGSGTIPDRSNARAEIRRTEKAMFFEHVEASCISDESMPWMPLGLAPGVEVKFFKADPIRGELIALLKAPADAKLPRHHHSGTVVVYTLKGKWKYKEHDWIAGPGNRLRNRRFDSRAGG